MERRPVTRSQTAIEELATAYFDQGLGAIPDDEMELLFNNPQRVTELMNQIKQQSQQHHVVTRSQIEFEKLAKHYLEQGFINIPQDELRVLGANAALVLRLMQQIATLKHIEKKLSLRPEVSRESIVGPIVGSEYQKLMNDFNTLAQQQQSMGGKKRFRKNTKNYKAIKSKKSKKSKKAMQRKGKKTYKKLKSKR